VSEDTTQDMSEKYDTKPTIETVLERINEMRGELLEGINELRGEMLERFKELRVEMDVRFDRVESIASGTRAEFLTLRADFRELKHALGEHIPALKS
jgi:arginyl-tRNA synthetase